MIKTVLGAVEPRAFGFCHSHEHIYIRPALPKECPVSPMDDYGRSLAELLAFRRAGGSALVDCQPLSAGADLEVLRRLSRESGIHIIASTGFHRSFFYTKESSLEGMPGEEMEERFLGEIRAGAGVVKTAVEAGGISRRDRELHRAAALAAAQTGVPVIIHVEKHCSLTEILDFYGAYSIEPARMILCHCDRMIPDLEEHARAAKLGAYLEYDTIGRFKYHDNEKEIDTISRMLEMGFEKQLLLSLDSTRQRLESYGGEVGLPYLIREFLPLMREAGVCEEAIRAMTVHNPARAFAGVD